MWVHWSAERSNVAQLHYGCASVGWLHCMQGRAGQVATPFLLVASIDMGAAVRRKLLVYQANILLSVPQPFKHTYQHHQSSLLVIRPNTGLEAGLALKPASQRCDAACLQVLGPRTGFAKKASLKLLMPTLVRTHPRWRDANLWVKGR